MFTGLESTLWIMGTITKGGVEGGAIVRALFTDDTGHADSLHERSVDGLSNQRVNKWRP